MATDDYITQDEAKTVAAVAAHCLTWGGWRRWGLIMRYGRLFTPGLDTGGGAWPAQAEDTGRLALRRATDSGLVYAEGYACHPVGMHIPKNWAWCLEGGSVVDPGANEPGTAYFGVALRPDYLRRVRAARRDAAGSDGFSWAFAAREADEVTSPPLDPGTDTVAGVGRDIPASVRDWALTAERHPGGTYPPPAWVMEELLTFGGQSLPDPPDQWLDYLGFPPAPGPGRGAGGAEPSAAAHPYAAYRVRRADWLDSGMALQCDNPPGGTFTDDGVIVSEIQFGDSLDTLLRLAGEHRLRSTQGAGPGDQEPGPHRGAEVQLKQVTGDQADRTFAVLRRLDYNVWAPWLSPSPPASLATAEAPLVRLARNGTSYEMALMTALRAMGAELPEEFGVSYLVPPPGRADTPPPASYARHVVYQDGTAASGIGLLCSGQTGGLYSGMPDGPLGQVQDGDTLGTLQRVADEHRPQCAWDGPFPANEHEHPERIIDRPDAVCLQWVTSELYENTFTELRHLGGNRWGVLLQPQHLQAQAMSEQTAVRQAADVDGYEAALLAVFRAMGDRMPADFIVRYLF